MQHRTGSLACNIPHFHPPSPHVVYGTPALAFATITVGGPNTLENCITTMERLVDLVTLIFTDVRECCRDKDRRR